MTDQNASRPTRYTQLMRAEDISVANLWTTFAMFVCTPEMSAAQREEMRLCFYAGFLEAFKVINDVSHDLPEERAAIVLANIDKENHEFLHQMVGKVQARMEREKLTKKGGG